MEPRIHSQEQALHRADAADVTLSIAGAGVAHETAGGEATYSLTGAGTAWVTEGAAGAAQEAAGVATYSITGAAQEAAVWPHTRSLELVPR